ncbi:MAG TPA: hypothetical protein PK542_05245, partial [Treponemataceae bacterium]|nr:hypothetical protein [Treponemataceae bacterium]
MNEILNALFVLVLILNLFALGNGRILSVIKIVAVQGVLLGIIPLFIHAHLTAPEVITSVATIALKGFIIPAMMTKALRDVQIKREVEPLIGLLPSTILGALAIGITFLAFAGAEPAALPIEQLVLRAPLVIAAVSAVLLLAAVCARTESQRHGLHR